MRIPKRVNAVLDWMEQHLRALAVVVALVLLALAATLLPTWAGLPTAAFVLGAAAGGFMMHSRMARRVARAHREVDDLLRENGRLRHRYNIMASGVITRGSLETQAIVPIPEDDLLAGPDDPQATANLPELTDELLGMGRDDDFDTDFDTDDFDTDRTAANAVGDVNGDVNGGADGDAGSGRGRAGPGDTADLEEIPEESHRG